ncbi:hypothetical protein MP228_008832 [Amoeboaphelidium protococcarum]|nr:hypothetical protein MP228_008832 [Amoeboaphelidium protococcarum]
MMPGAPVEAQKTMQDHIEMLKNTSVQLAQIAQYCRSLYAQPPMNKDQYDQVDMKVRSYAADGLSTFVQNLNMAMGSYEQKVNECKRSVQDCETNVQFISTKLTMIHEELSRKSVGFDKDYAAITKPEKHRRIDRPFHLQTLVNADKKLNLFKYDSIGHKLM